MKYLLEFVIQLNNYTNSTVNAKLLTEILVYKGI